MLTSPIHFPGLGLTLDPPKAIPITENFSIYFYGIIIAFGLMLAVIYGLRRSKQFGLKDDDILDGVLFIVPFAILCARLYYCIFKWEELYASNPLSALYIWEGGLAIYGGVIGAVIGIAVFSWIKKVDMRAVLDLVLVSFLIGQAIGRWGNFFNREAFGAQTDFFLRMGLNLTADGKYSAEMLYYHPTFLYESLWNALGFAVLHFLTKHRRYDGQLALGYAAWYGLGRTLIEGLRTDSLYLGAFRVSQLLAAVSCLVAVCILVWQAFRPHDPAKLFVNRVAAAAEEKAEENTEEQTEE